MKRQNLGAWRVFFFSFAAALCLFILGIGFVLVDYQGRKLSFGDDQPPFQVVEHQDGTADLKIKLMGKETELDVTAFDKMLKFICEFGCLPHS